MVTHVRGEFPLSRITEVSPPGGFTNAILQSTSPGAVDPRPGSFRCHFPTDGRSQMSLSAHMHCKGSHIHCKGGSCVHQTAHSHCTCVLHPAYDAASDSTASHACECNNAACDCAARGDPASDHARSCSARDNIAQHCAALHGTPLSSTSWRDNKLAEVAAVAREIILESARVSQRREELAKRKAGHVRAKELES